MEHLNISNRAIGVKGSAQPDFASDFVGLRFGRSDRTQALYPDNTRAAGDVFQAIKGDRAGDSILAIRQAGGAGSRAITAVVAGPPAWSLARARACVSATARSPAR